MKPKDDDLQIIYDPFPKQKIFHDSPALNRLFWGAAGPGKSTALRFETIRIAQSAPNLHGGVFRRTYPELEASVILPLLDALPKGTYKYNEQKHIMSFDNGSRIKFGHVQYDKDVYKYQGEEFDFLAFDELTLFNEFQYKFLKSRLRTTKDYWTPCMFATTNPGNIWHAWVKRIWIDQDLSNDEKKETWDYIPALVYDNPVLMENDPAYVARLEGLPEDQKKAMLYGDWDSFQGQYFKEWRRDVHVIQPFMIPDTWKRWMALDYWYSAPSSVHWYAMDHDRNVYVYRELYKTKLTYEELIDELIDMMEPEEFKSILWLAADPALQTKSPDTRVSFFDIAKKKGFNIIPGINDRVPWWQVVRSFLKVTEGPNLTGTARLRIFSTCANLIRTLPQLIYDDRMVEDLNSDGEDHAGDDLRYALVSVSKGFGSLSDIKKANDNKAHERRQTRGGGTIMQERF